MTQEKIYPKGLRTFKPNENAPDFVKGKLIITMNELFTFCKENEALLTEYKGNKQLNCDILEGKNGIYFVVNDFKPKAKEPGNVSINAKDLPYDNSGSEDLPF